MTKWELQFSPLPLPRIKGQIAAWLGQIPNPTAIAITASGAGFRMMLYMPPGMGLGAISAWGGLDPTTISMETDTYIK